MKRATILATFLLALSTPLFAQSSSPAPAGGSGTPEDTQAATPASDAAADTMPAMHVEMPQPAPSKAPDLFSNFVGAGLEGLAVDNDSSKFREYRELPEGLTGPDLRLFNSSEATRFIVTGENLTQRDRRIFSDFMTSAVRVQVMYDQIPHRLGNGAKSIENRVAFDQWGISDFVQRSLQTTLEAQFATNKSAITYPYLRSLVEPLVNTPYVFDLGYERRRLTLNVMPFPDAAVDTRITYFQENRTGTRAAGTSFGFGNVVETAEPIDYKTREVGLRAEMPLKSGLVRGALVVNQFNNAIGSYTFDNPFRASDSTDASAYQAPGTASVNGAAMGRVSTPPDNRQITLSLGGIYKFPMNSRLTADASFGRITQNEDLMPFTSNSAIVLPGGIAGADPASLPVQSFDGRINTTSANVAFNTRPVPHLSVTAKYRYYDLDNKSERVEFPGYVRFDAVFQPTGRITVPYGYKTQRAEVLGSYDFRVASIEGGVRNERVNRTFRETDETTENIFHIAADVRPVSWLVARSSFEFGSRDYDHYELEHSEDASFTNPGPVVNQEELRRYDQAARDTQRIVTMVQVSPFDGAVNFGVNYVRYFDDYTKKSDLGLLEWRTQSLNFDADYTPSERWNVFAFFGVDNYGGFQRGRQSGATPSTNELDNWTAYNTDKAKTLGGGANFTFIPDKLDLRLTGRVQTVNGRAQLESPPGGTPDLAFDIPAVDDTRLFTTTAEATYRISPRWDVVLGGWVEHYHINDDLSSGTQMYMPNAFFFAANDADYQGNVAYVRTAFHW